MGKWLVKKKKNRHKLVYTITQFCPFMLVCINSIFCFVSTTRTHSWSANPATGSGRQEILLVVSKSWLAGQNSRDVNGNNDSTKETKIGTEDPLNSDITYSSIQHCSTDAEEGGGGGGANRNILLLSCFHCISPSYFNLQACGSLYDCTHTTYNAAADTARSAWGCWLSDSFFWTKWACEIPVSRQKAKVNRETGMWGPNMIQDGETEGGRGRNEVQVRGEETGRHNQDTQPRSTEMKWRFIKSNKAVYCSAVFIVPQSADHLHPMKFLRLSKSNPEQLLWCQVCWSHIMAAC